MALIIVALLSRIMPSPALQEVQRSPRMRPVV